MNDLVYSTDQGKMCPKCNQPVKQCDCKNQKVAPAGDGIVRVSRETKGRKGKDVTLISGVPLNSKELKLLSKQLKNKCGSGGTIKNHIIEIQGDHRELVIGELKKKGWVVKQSGG